MPTKTKTSSKRNAKARSSVARGSESAPLRRVEANLRKQAEWYRTRPGDPHAINTALYVANLDMANAINEALSPNKADMPTCSK